MNIEKLSENDYEIQKFTDNIEFSTTAKESSNALQREYINFRDNSSSFVQDVLVEKLINKKNMRQAAKMLGVWRKGGVMLSDEDDMSILMDFILHNFYIGTMNNVNYFYEKNNTLLSEADKLTLTLLNKSLYRILVVIEILPSSGIVVYDILNLQKLLLIDMGLADTGAPGVVLSTNTIHTGNYITTTGAGFGVNHVIEQVYVMIEKLRKKTNQKWHDFNELPTKFRTDFVTSLIKKGLRYKNTQLSKD